jgi:hypothetical protein
MRRMAIALLLLAAACGSSDTTNTPATPLVGDPAGQRAFTGSYVAGTKNGTCTITVSPAGTAAGACTAPASIVASGALTAAAACSGSGSLSGTYTPGQNGAGTLSLHSSDNCWTFSAQITGTSANDTLEAEITANGVAGAAVLKDATVAKVTSYCGKFSGSDLDGALSGGLNFQTESDRDPGTLNGIALGQNGKGNPVGGVLIGSRASGKLDIKFFDPTNNLSQVGTASGTIAGGAVADGQWKNSDNTGSGTWTVQVCAGDGAIPFCCEGTGAATKCCLAKCDAAGKCPVQ